MSFAVISSNGFSTIFNSIAGSRFCIKLILLPKLGGGFKTEYTAKREVILVECPLLDNSCFLVNRFWACPEGEGWKVRFRLNKFEHVLEELGPWPCIRRGWGPYWRDTELGSCTKGWGSVQMEHVWDPLQGPLPWIDRLTDRHVRLKTCPSSSFVANQWKIWTRRPS